jgi:hypothetical protein
MDIFEKVTFIVMIRGYICLYLRFSIFLFCCLYIRPEGVLDKKNYIKIKIKIKNKLEAPLEG